MIDQRLLARVDELIEQGNQVLQTEYGYSAGSSGFVEPGVFSEWSSKSLSFLTRILGASDTYTASYAAQCRANQSSHVHRGIGILRAVHGDISGGHLATLRELVHADVFSDFLEMAEYLMDEGHGYKDAAAVLAGGVLEEHLRQLCQRHAILTETLGSRGPKPKKAELMNTELASANVYSTNQQKMVTGWLGTRNDAAHGRYDQYEKAQVQLLIAGVRDFIARLPA
jgi:hypothetical protein